MLRLRQGSKYRSLYSAIHSTQHFDIPVAIGFEPTETGYLKVDIFQKTNITGVFVSGNNNSMMHSVNMAVMSGNVLAPW